MFGSERVLLKLDDLLVLSFGFSILSLVSQRVGEEHSTLEWSKRSKIFEPRTHIAL